MRRLILLALLALLALGAAVGLARRYAAHAGRTLRTKICRSAVWMYGISGVP